MNLHTSDFKIPLPAGSRVIAGFSCDLSTAQHKRLRGAVRAAFLNDVRVLFVDTRFIEIHTIDAHGLMLRNLSKDMLGGGPVIGALNVQGRAIEFSEDEATLLVKTFRPIDLSRWLPTLRDWAGDGIEVRLMECFDESLRFTNSL